ncbi:MAG TPA: YcaO-like family protein [Candidatus Dormibacteraeota bacterium]|nr:YcaO-like family protein [Candidatus Dormibacteraeota bacterium]
MTRTPNRVNPKRAIDSETGIIRWLSEIPVEPGEPEIFNYAAKMADTGKYLPLRCVDNNGGAGLTREHAYLAAVGEALERYCCSIYFKDDLRLGSYGQVSQVARALHPKEVALFHAEQRSHVRYDWFTEETQLCWTWGVAVTKKEPMLLPACMCYIPYFPFFRDEGERTIAPSISTGQATGSSWGDALLRGLFEIVERDAFSITWLNQLGVPQIDIQSSEVVGRAFEEHFARPYLQYSLHSLATDFGIPSILCIVVDTSRQPPMICSGGASHLDPERAALKALVEAAQTREWAKFMGRSGELLMIDSDYGNITDFEQHVFLYGYGDMLPSIRFLLDGVDRISFMDIPNRSTGNRRADLALSLNLVESQGCEVLAVDLTTDDVGELGFRVVKTFVPLAQSLEGDHTHRFLGGSRLREVPRKLGYPAKGDLASFNPDPHPYP